MIQFYGYPKCSTCQAAKKFLQQKNVEFQELDLTVTPPSRQLLEASLQNGYKILDLFNKSGQLYREWNMKEKVKTMPLPELLQVLSENGKLIKRPFITDHKNFTVGFAEKLFSARWT